MKHLVPFRYFERNGKAYCPKCSVYIFDEVKRRMCCGGWTRLWSCPQVEHFHRKCKNCNGTWLEATFESDSIENQTTIKLILSGFLTRTPEMTEEELVKIWREAQVKSIHDE